MAYINTEHLFKCETCRHCKGEIKCDTFCDTGEQYIPDMSKIPTADVEEVRHGEWIWKELYGEIGVMLCCSECLETEGARENANYCPSCGAKMDGKKEEE